jgi:hypothetical protein
MYSDVLERNIQANHVGDIFGLKVWLNESKQGRDLYIELLMLNGCLYERAGSIYNESYFIEEELKKLEEFVKKQYENAEKMCSKRLEYYSGVWAKMLKSELDSSRVNLCSYNKFKIIFGENVISEEEFNKVRETLKNKQLELNAAQRAEDTRKKIEKRIAAENAVKERREIIKARIFKGEDITGQDLMDMCGLYNIQVPIRTKGFILDKISTVNRVSCSGKVKSGQKLTNHPSVYYIEIKSRLEGENLIKLTKDSYELETQTKN